MCVAKTTRVVPSPWKPVAMGELLCSLRIHSFIHSFTAMLRLNFRESCESVVKLFAAWNQPCGGSTKILKSYKSVPIPHPNWWLNINQHITTLIYQILIKYLLCATYCVECWNTALNNEKSLLPVKKIDSKQVNNIFKTRQRVVRKMKTIGAMTENKTRGESFSGGSGVSWGVYKMWASWKTKETGFQAKESARPSWWGWSKNRQQSWMAGD